MPPKRKVKQAARATLAKAARHSRESAVLGVPPPPTSVHFEDAEELQEILAEVTARPAVQDAGASLEAVVMANGHPSQVAWEQQVDAHLANTERLLLEMHGVLQSALTNIRSEVSIGLHLPLRCTPSQRNNNFAICGISPRARLSGTSTVSTVSYCHKINSHSDPCNNFM